LTAIQYALYKDSDIDDFFDEIKLAADVCPSEVHFQTLLGMGIKAISRIKWECNKSVKSQYSLASSYSNFTGHLFSIFSQWFNPKIVEVKPNLEEIVLCLHDLMHKLSAVHNYNYDVSIKIPSKLDEDMELWQKYLFSESKLVEISQNGKLQKRRISVILNSFMKRDKRVVVNNVES